MSRTKKIYISNKWERFHGICYFAIASICTLSLLLVLTNDLSDAVFHQQHIAYSISFFTFFLVNTILYIICWVSNPGHVYVPQMNSDQLTTSDHSQCISTTDDENTDDQHRLINVTQRKNQKVCKVCNIWKPPKSKHCWKCGHCIAKFDHHCPFIGNCVGGGNHMRFLVFCLSHTLLTTWAFNINLNSFSPDQDMYSWLARAALSFFLFLTGVIGWGLTCFHTYGAFTGITTYEIIKAHNTFPGSELTERERLNRFFMETSKLDDGEDITFSSDSLLPTDVKDTTKDIPDESSEQDDPLEQDDENMLMNVFNFIREHVPAKYIEAEPCQNNVHDDQEDSHVEMKIYSSAINQTTSNKLKNQK